MSRRRNRKFENSRQLHFHFNVEPGEICALEGGDSQNLSDFDFALRLALKETLDTVARRETDPLDRIEVAARMSRKLGREITKTHIDQWVALSAVQRRIHADALKALCEVTGDWRALHRFVEACGLKALHPDEAVCAEYGAKMLFRRMIDTDIKGILSEVDEDSLRRKLLSRAMTERARGQD